METISEKIRKAIIAEIKSGVTPYAISKALNMPQAILSRWLTDDKSKQRGISVETQDKLAAYLGLTVTPLKRKGRE